MLEVALPMGPPAPVAPLVVNAGAVPIGDLLAGEASAHPAMPYMPQQHSKPRRIHAACCKWCACMGCTSLVPANHTSKSVATCLIARCSLLCCSFLQGVTAPTCPRRQ
jgi:hypothetical protein